MKNLTWALIVLFTTGFALGCGGSDDDETATALTGTEAGTENTEAAEEETGTETAEEEATAGGEEEAAAGGEEEAAAGGEEEAAAGGEEEAEETGDPCAFAGPIGVEGEEDPELTWTSATLEEGSGPECPGDDAALGFLNEDDEEDDEEDDGDDDDCEPVQKTDVDTCTFTIECDDVTAEFTATEDGNVEASFSVAVESEDGSASIECNYTVTGTVTLPE